MTVGGGQDEDFGDELDLPVGAIEDLDRNAITLSQRLHRRLTDHNSEPTAVSQAHHPPSSDYGFDDDDVIDLDDPDLSLAEDRAIAAYFKHEGGQNGHVNLVDKLGQDETRPDTSMGMQELQARLAELEHERSTLVKTLEDVKSDAIAKDGAVAILRSKHDKSTKEYERRISVMQQLHADELAKQKKELETARKEQETVKTNNRFLEHDLAQELERAKKLKSTKPPNTSASTYTSPRAERYSDGFDTNEIVVVSPSKATRTEDKITTPKKGRKRKRDNLSSPSIPLDIAPSEKSPPNVVDGPPNGDHIVRVIPHKGPNLRIVQHVLQYVSLNEDKPAVEIMARYRCPGHKQQTMSTVFLHGLASLSGDDDAKIHAEVLSLCVKLWLACLEEKYHEPINLLIDLTDFIVVCSTTAHTTEMMAQMVHVTTRTIDLLAVPRALAARASVSTTTTKAKAAKRDVYTDNLDIDTCLQLLHTMTISTTLKESENIMFWKGMEFDFVLLMLHKAQPMHHVVLMLQMIAVSSTTDTFGVIVEDAQRQAKNETDLLDRLTLLFSETFDIDVSSAYSREEYANLRIEIASTLSSISANEHGSKSLAQHKMAFGRMVRFLCGQITYLYDVRPNISGYVEEGFVSLHDQVIEVINLTTRIIYQLMHDHAELINIREKLSVIHGGHHKFLIAFSRIAFSERLCFEAGLEDEVVDAAHEILDAVLSPEEGDAVVKAVQTPRTVGDRTSGLASAADGQSKDADQEMS